GPMINVETWNLNSAANISVRDELSVAAALWDLNDAANDDPASFGHTVIQSVYTSDEFEYEGDVFDDDCTFATFARAWVDTGQPTDANAAAAISQNTGFTFPPPSSSLAQNVQSLAANGLPEESVDYKWWNQLTTVVDNSQSMAFPTGKFNAVKMVLTEMVNDLGAEPEGTEFALHTFSNTSNGQAIFAGQFFSEDVLPLISNLSTTSGGDATCKVNALRALANAVEKDYGVDAWLFTDGDTNLSPAVGTITQLLHDRKVRASFALLGLCPPTATSMSIAADGLTAEEEQAYRILRGAARSYLGLASEETPGGVVPYLLTAIASGGQFLYVDESQLANAADVLQAQMTHSAGAGRWSDYVSDTPTYEWDKLATWEYNWIDASSGGTSHGIPGAPYYSVYIQFPGDRTIQGMPYYGQGPYTAVSAHKHGYLTFGRQPVGVAPANTQLPNPAAPNNAIYPFWDDLTDLVPCLSGAAPDAPQCQIPTTIYSKQAGEWFAIEYFRFPADGGKDTVTFEVLLNRDTGEIRFQYLDVPSPSGTSSATIGIENSTGSSGIEVGYNTAAKAASGMGYKFLPMPPQPAKTYTVTVDSLMGGLGFLLTGYSGSFEDLVVRYPNGTQVSCADTENVLCLNLGLVQYVQADADGRTGEWTATVNAGPTGSGTFSFTSFSVSALSVESFGDRSLSTGSASPLQVNLGQAVDDNHLTGWFRQPNDSPFGAPFTLYDDGAHGDGPAGDGLFGSDPYTPAGAGTGYLWVQGKLGGVDFVRADPVPYVFQPISVTALGDGANNGEETILQFVVQNHDSHSHCYSVYMQAPEGWSTSMPDTFFCLGPGVMQTLNVEAKMSSTSPNTLPSGTTGVVDIAVVEYEEGVMTDSASARVTRRRLPASILIDNRTDHLRPNGDTARLGFLVGDDQGVPVAEGTLVTLTASMGTILPSVGSTR
ncbi:MAG TPA: vWA domain-containing protein, partial [Anaerolineae bacterium]|nr:vWA domain-containing protein [Anaerolineae bacterium]